MPKDAKLEPPTFLQKKLEGKTLAFVKQHLTPFLDQVKKDKNDKFPDTLTLVVDFVQYLSKLDKAFKKINSKTLVTTYEGVNHMYDLIRRRVAVREGKTVTTSDPPSKKPTPDKVTTRLSKQSQIKEKEPVTQITADYHGHSLDEKETPYRKEVNDEASSLGISRTKSD